MAATAYSAGSVAPTRSCETASAAQATATKRDVAAPWGFRGLGPLSRNTETASGSRFPRTGGRHTVELLSAYLNLHESRERLQKASSVLSPRQLGAVRHRA
jgi:hypothetical protein